MSVILLLTTVSRRLRLIGNGHDGGGGVRSGGAVLGIGEAVKVLTGCINGAVDWTLCGASHTVFLCLIQVV